MLLGDPSIQAARSVASVADGVARWSCVVAAFNPLDADADPFRPPTLSVLVHCLHCGEEYESYRIEWRLETDHGGQPHGFWCCPIANCGGRGFGFDIFPVDPEYRDEDGNRMWFDDEEEAEGRDGKGSNDTSSDTDPADKGNDEALPWED
jgi:hypothetical protein